MLKLQGRINDALGIMVALAVVNFCNAEGLAYFVVAVVAAVVYNAGCFVYLRAGGDLQVNEPFAIEFMGLWIKDKRWVNFLGIVGEVDQIVDHSGNLRAFYPFDIAIVGDTQNYIATVAIEHRTDGFKQVARQRCLRFFELQADVLPLFE